MLEYLDNKTPLNMAQYACADFNTYFDNLLKNIKAQYQDEYDDFGKTSLGVMNVHLYSYGLSQLSWMLDRRVSSLYFETAETLQELTRLAKTKNYKVSPATPGSGELEIECPALSGTVVMSAGFKFINDDGLIFETLADKLLPIGTTSFTVTVAEGESQELNFTATGEPNQDYPLAGIDNEENNWLAQHSVKVYVNGVLWEEKEFLELEKTNQYEVIYTEDPPYVLFGDRIVGNVPENNADIVIKYRIISGKEGNTNSGTITDSEDDLTVGGEIIDLTINNPDAFSGGADPESKKSIKKMAPLHISASGAAVTEEDYDYHVNKFSDPTYGSVAKGYAAVARNTGNDLVTVGYNNDIKTFLNDLDTENIIRIDEVDDKIGTTSTDSTILWYLQNIEDNYTEFATVLQNSLDELEEGSIVDANLDIRSNAKVISSVKSAIESRVQDIVDSDPGSPVVDLCSQIDNYLNNQLVNSINSINSDTDTIQSSLTNILGNIDEVTEKFVLIYVYAQQAKTLVSTIKTTLSNLKSFISDKISQSKITLQSLMQHLDELFDADCKSNLISIPILTTNGEGFYTSPSNGLIKALEAYLSEIKEVTTFIQVVDGSVNLVEADIVIKAKLSPVVVKSEKESEIVQVIDEILKSRDFGEDLYLQHIYNELKPIDGVNYLNVEIISPASYLDDEGNLIVDNMKVITKGEVTLEVE